MHDGGDVVGADVALDELARGQLDALGTQRRRVQVVEDDHVDASVGRFEVGAHVALDRPGGEQRALDAFERDVHHREGRHLLRLAVLEHLEVGRLEVGDEFALAIEHARVNLDVVDLGAERDRRLLRRLLLRMPLRGGRSQPKKGDAGEKKSFGHNKNSKSAGT